MEGGGGCSQEATAVEYFVWHVLLVPMVCLHNTATGCS